MATGDYSTSYKLSSEFEIAPLRSLDDFILSSARFQLPQFNDVNRWSNRIVCNLLYYQTNYLLLMAGIFSLISLMHPRDMILGFVCVGLALAVFFYATTKQADVLAFKKEHPLISISIILIGGYISVYMAGSLVVFMFSMAFPLLVTFVHASLRLRNMNNKIVNQAEAAGVTKTAMGRLLDIIGYKPELIRID